MCRDNCLQCRSRKLYNFVTKIDRLGTSFVVVVVKPPVSAMHCSRTHVHGMNKTFARVGAILHSLWRFVIFRAIFVKLSSITMREMVDANDRLGWQLSCCRLCAGNFVHGVFVMCRKMLFAVQVSRCWCVRVSSFKWPSPQRHCMAPSPNLSTAARPVVVANNVPKLPPWAPLIILISIVAVWCGFGWIGAFFVYLRATFLAFFPLPAVFYWCL